MRAGPWLWGTAMCHESTLGLAQCFHETGHWICTRARAMVPAPVSISHVPTSPALVPSQTQGGFQHELGRHAGHAQQIVHQAAGFS